MPKTVTMAMLRRFYEWVFYGHLWIALGAASLGWVSQGMFSTTSLPWWLVPLFLFLATLGVYTMHRLLSYRRAERANRFRRYGIVHRHPKVSAAIGWLSLLGAGLCCCWFPPVSWLTLILAVPFTFFYLIPIWPGGKRLRDYSYLKVVWVAMSWTLMTAIFPMVAQSLDQYSIMELWITFRGQPTSISSSFYVYQEIAVRFFFTLSVAILFDFRDVKLDASQSVHTLANQHSALAKGIIYALMVLCVFGQLDTLTVTSPENPEAEGIIFAARSLPYLLTLPVAWLTSPQRSEDWYAVWVNGLLLLPGLMFLLGGVWLD
ncbi:hypothetical protein [Lewinella sp. W8]|uniref:hypothetical protein n=1 Tax=Lewinella sp. W8 TaxID=2528208 RepID=UPI0011A9DC4E|nr:hypothetical protein [Lewinella sp. W8]MTB52272.1 hypothetical protein [Lewinella sp. W8]